MKIYTKIEENFQKNIGHLPPVLDRLLNPSHRVSVRCTSCFHTMAGSTDIIDEKCEVCGRLGLVPCDIDRAKLRKVVYYADVVFSQIFLDAEYRAQLDTVDAVPLTVQDFTFAVAFSLGYEIKDFVLFRSSSRLKDSLKELVEKSDDLEAYPEVIDKMSDEELINLLTFDFVGYCKDAHGLELE